MDGKNFDGILSFKAVYKNLMYFGRKGAVMGIIFNDDGDRLKKLQKIYMQLCEEPPLAGLDINKRGKLYLEKNCTVVKGPTPDFEKAQSKGTASWLCKTSKDNWFLLHKNFVLKS